MADRIADEHGVSREKLHNLVYHESRWNPKALGDHGKARGLVQIHSDFFPDVTDEQAYDPEFALNFAARAISQGWEYKWTVCNCYSLVRSKYGDLPRMADIQPTAWAPIEGGIAIFYYNDKETGKRVKHIAITTAIEATGFWVFESNYEGCKVGNRFVSFEDVHYVGSLYFH